ncbi:MAG: AbrB/MazE/SpoVT family DNA-binding domain-containing protein, partial [Gammaproteobacteria bacterium]
MSVDNPVAEVTVGAQGRVVIPAELRKALDLKPGERLIARREGDRLVLERREAVEQRLWEMFAAIPADESLVDELIALTEAAGAAILAIYQTEFDVETKSDES